MGLPQVIAASYECGGNSCYTPLSRDLLAKCGFRLWRLPGLTRFGTAVVSDTRVTLGMIFAPEGDVKSVIAAIRREGCQKPVIVLASPGYSVPGGGNVFFADPNNIRLVEETIRRALPSAS